MFTQFVVNLRANQDLNSFKNYSILYPKEFYEPQNMSNNKNWKVYCDRYGYFL